MEQEQKPDAFGDLMQKASVKLVVNDRMEQAFKLVGEVLRELEGEFREKMKDLDSRLLPEVRVRGNSEIEFKIATDVLVFSLLPEVYEFDRQHPIWKTGYAQKFPLATYCGIINIYNFLNDSFRLNRSEDLGYLISRVFVNSEGAFYVEGKRQVDYLTKEFGKGVIDKVAIRNILETSVLYALGFDLLVPPYDEVKIISVEMMNQKIEKSKSKTGKRLGFKFNSDDIN